MIKKLYNLGIILKKTFILFFFFIIINFDFNYFKLFILFNNSLFFL